MKFFFSLLILSLSVQAYGVTKLTLTPEKGKVEFVAIGRPAMLKIEGQGKGPAGELQIENNSVTGDFKFQLADLSTGISLRDEHMKEKYLEVGHYPTAVLAIKSLKIGPLAVGQSQNGVAFEGQLTLHGVTRPVSGTADVALSSSGYEATSHFNVKLSDYKIDIPSYMGLTVADQVNVNVTINVKR